VSAVSTQNLHTPGVEIRARFPRPDHPIAYGYPEVTSVFRQDLTLHQVREADIGQVVLQWGSEPFAYYDEKSLDDGPWGVGDELERESQESKPGSPSEAQGEPESASGHAEEIDLVVSGGMKGESELEGRPAILDIPLGRGRIVAFGFDPIHRTLSRSDFRLVWNALLNWNDLPEPAANPPRVSRAPSPISDGD
jgi:hypothetical protein